MKKRRRLEVGMQVGALLALVLSTGACQGLLLSGELNCENDGHCPDGSSCSEGSCKEGGGNGSGNDGGNGGLVGEPLTEAGQVIFSEIMEEAEAASNNFQWVELRNISPGKNYDLQGCVLGANNDSAAENSHAIGESVVIPKNDYGVLAKTGNADAAKALYEWPSDFEISRFKGSGGVLSLTCGGVLIDEVAHDFLLTDGGADETFESLLIRERSVALDKDILDHVENDNPASWCLETATYTLNGNIVQGSPGEENACNAL
jgi:hypothetical protein